MFSFLKKRVDISITATINTDRTKKPKYFRRLQRCSKFKEGNVGGSEFITFALLRIIQVMSYSRKRVFDWPIINLTLCFFSYPHF